MGKEIAIGVDIGGSHVSCQGYDLAKKKLVENTLSENDLDNHASPDEIIASWGAAIKNTIGKAGADKIAGIGFAMPGPYDYENGISQFTGQNGKYENTYGMNVPLKMRAFLGLSDTFKFRFMNDASAFAVGEAQVGKTAGFGRSLALTLGTGFGSAFISDGVPVVEGDGVPGEGCLWHLPYHHGIADDYFSTRGLCKRFNELKEQQVKEVKEIAELASQGNRSALNVFADFGTKLGLFLQPWVKLFGAEAIVIGGNISKAFDYYRKELKESVTISNSGVEISISELKESASFIGSATLIDDDFYEKVLPVLGKM